MNAPTTTDWALIRDEWQKTQDMGHQAVLQAARVGDLLIKQQGDMSQREFAKLAGQHVPGMSQSTISRLETLARNLPLIEDKRPESLRQAIDVIQAHNRPQTVTDSRVNHLALESGPRVSHPQEANTTTSQLRETLTAEIRAELQAQYDEEIAAHRARLDADKERETKSIRDALTDAWQECRAMQERLNARAKGVNGFMDQQEWKMLVGLMHPDRYEGCGLSETHKRNLTQGFQILQRLKAAVDPLTPIKVLREQGWEGIAPAHKRRRAQR